jgi:predicted nuclease of restriction endonuclease-like RecB superfamily
MLTGNLVRVRLRGNRVVPLYIDPTDPALLGVAERLLEAYRSGLNQTRGELEETLTESVGDMSGQLVHQGLAKLLEDRCEFETVSGHPPEQLRELVFRAAALRRLQSASAAITKPTFPRLHEASPPAFDRGAVLQEVADGLGVTAPEVEAGLFADLKTEQRLIKFDDVTPERLLERYNVALAQAVLLRSTGVVVSIYGETPQRYRALLRGIKFHRLVCDADMPARDSCRLRLDGPLSLFTATQKYGLQLALFLPALLNCQAFELRADLRWGAQRKDKLFVLTSDDGLVSTAPDYASYTPPELTMFAELFRKKHPGWLLLEEAEVFPLGGEGFWAPDFRLVHGKTGRVVRLEVLGFWRKASAEKHLERLRRHVTEPFLLAVSDQLHIEDAELTGLPAEIHRFRQMPLPDEIARQAEALLGRSPPAAR